MKIIKKFFTNILTAFGALWLFIEVFDFFGGEAVSFWLKEKWWIFLIVGVTFAVIESIPKKRFVFPITGRDCKIEVVVGDIFKQKGPIVVGTNTELVVDEEIISPKSIQGQFCKRYYKNYKALNEYFEKEIGKQPVDFGDTVKVEGSGKVAYFCAVAELNEHGVAHSTNDNIFKALSGLWDYLANHADKDIINVPILGSGLSRVDAPRELLAHEIIKSFLAALSQFSNFCDGIRLVIYAKDIREHQFDLNKFLTFVGALSKYGIPKVTLNGRGQPIN